MNDFWRYISYVNMNQEDFEGRGKRPSRKAKVITPEIIAAIEAYLDEEVEKKVKRKQRYTARKIYNNLRERGIYQGSERSVHDVVKKLREQRGQPKLRSFLPLSFPLGSVLEIDHGEVDLEINGRRLTAYLFVASVPGFVIRYCQIFPIKSQEAWGEFHERAFQFFGGTFTRVVYDNDSVLVKKVLGSERHQTTFSLSLEEHFHFESHFCNLAAGNEKGAVENAVGYCRRNFLPALPSYSSWDEANQHLTKCCHQDIDQGNHYKTQQSLKSLFEELKQKVEALRPEKFWCKWSNNRVDSCQLITIDHHEYSVPEKYIGGFVRVGLGIFQIKIFKDDELIAIHERQYGDDDSLILDHYLDQLQYKSSSFWDCKAVTQHQFDPRFLEIWDRLSDKYSKKEANRKFVQILLLQRRYSHDNLLKAVELSLKYGALEPSAVENIVHQFETDQPVYNQEDWEKALKKFEVTSWSFDISVYAELCEEVNP